MEIPRIPLLVTARPRNSDASDLHRTPHPPNLRPPSPVPLPKHQSSHLNTLPRPRPLGTPRIHKRRMRHPRPLLAIRTLQQQPLPPLHAAPIPPPLPLRRLHPRRLPRAIGIAVLDANERVVGHAGAVGEGEREGLHGPVDGAPDVDDADAGFQ